MATQLQIRRGTSSQVSAFTGAVGELVVNTTNDSVHVNDGSTAGGFELARVDGSNWAITNNITTTANIDVGTVTADGLTVDGVSKLKAGSTSTPANTAAFISNASAKLVVNHGNEYGAYVGYANSSNDAIGIQSTTSGGTTAPLSLNPYGGNVGIGTAAASHKLEIESSSDADLLQVQSTAGSNDTALRLGISGDVATINATGGSTGILALKTYGTERLRVDASGDVSFYEDTGSTPKMFWDASAESLGIGQGVFSSGQALNLKGAGIAIKNDLSGSNNNWSVIRNTATSSESNISFVSGAGEAMVIDHYGDLTVKGGRIFVNESDNGNTAVAITRDADEGYVNLYSSGTQTVEIRGNGNSYLNGGNVLVNTTNAGATGLSVSNSSTISFAEGASYSLANIFRQSSSGDLVLASGYKYTDTANKYASSYGGSWAKSAVGVGYGYVRFFTGAASTDSVGTDLTPTEVARIDSSGNLLVSKTSVNTATVGVELRETGKGMFTASGTDPLFVNRLSSDGDIAKFFKDNGHVGSIGTLSGDLNIGSGDTGLDFSAGLDAIMPYNPSTNGLRDNTIDLGQSSVRFDDIYATNGTIQTSDRNEKQDIEALSDAEQRVAVAAKGLLRKFRWKSSVAENGDEARIHFGIIAQDLQAAFEAEGLDAGRYAMFINSTWTDEETGEERTRMGVRYSELLAFIIAAI